jgi:hypothetical protein
MSINEKFSDAHHIKIFLMNFADFSIVFPSDRPKHPHPSSQMSLDFTHSRPDTFSELINLPNHQLLPDRRPPNAKRQTPNAKRQTPNAERQTVNGER